MTTSKEKVLELVSSGKISAAEGEDLLQALQARRRNSWRLLINPFERLAAAQSVVLGVAAAAGELVLSRWNVRFDGALDVHIAPLSVSWRQALIDQAVAWPVTSVVLWIAALAVARQGRVLDFVGAVGVARIPLLPVGLAAAVLGNRLPVDLSKLPPVPPASLLVLAALAVPALIWSVTLLYQGYRMASGLRSPKSGVSFALGLVAAELVSKGALSVLG